MTDLRDMTLAEAEAWRAGWRAAERQGHAEARAILEDVVRYFATHGGAGTGDLWNRARHWLTRGAA